ncbi:MAG TPA: 50S ribosomal protein L25/general stress protein Ctc [Accumulibacter sp.]|nr:50S ribosomal protein L25/general stress protein Ctc [Accumulibacter sp.]HMW19338.1 50S ribosomal protein L25/general stress protein Ctc [Accumulibacter sp.]HMX21920.1 50S ribosomal protein L25/general stress protein Ctc [Accumulibacter sp.]HNC18881.1 50S ribosomal protein L25/general stress protein Ctc [Accumulibacter sp.]HND80996.1 50S ribosomal protein L25/general stress protein Ctc [Accumulibacter sp.]
MSFAIEAKKRTVQGSGASRRLRRANRVPAIVYGGSATPELIEVDHNQILIHLRKEAFHSSVITLTIDGVGQSVVLRDSQMHPWKPLVQHCDFQRVDSTHAIHQRIPLHFINDEIAPGVKLGGGQVAHILNDIEISCLPQDLPPFIEVDLQNLEAGHSIHVSELVFPAGVTPVVHGEDQVVVSILAKRSEDAEEDGEEGAAPAA